MEATPRQADERLLYASENGDRWSVLHDPLDGSLLIRHRPSASSGGQSSDTDLRTFLARRGDGPETQALLALIGSSVKADEGAHNSTRPGLDDLARDVRHALRELEMLLNTLARRSDGQRIDAARDDLLRASRELAIVGQRIGRRIGEVAP